VEAGASGCARWLDSIPLFLLALLCITHINKSRDRKSHPASRVMPLLQVNLSVLLVTNRRN